MYQWQKKGRLYKPEQDGFSHGSHPCMVQIEESIFLLAFTRRDKNNHSHIFLSKVIVEDGNIQLTEKPKLVLSPGKKGRFDCDGVISVAFVKHQNMFYLYYVGWQNLPDNMWICDTGRAVIEVETMTMHREFSGPVFGRDKHNPLFAAATAFHVSESGLWYSWYNSGISWTDNNEEPHHRYGIHFATSNNGVDWQSTPGLCIPFADQYEYAFGRPTVVKWENTFYMWYAHRATQHIESYRIGFAWSKDGQNWTREDKNAGIDVSEEGWDSEMICYPYVVRHQDYTYMLYNGNNYGQTGFGYAIVRN